MDPVLTRREKEVCNLLCRGLSNKEIAKELSISPRTVEDYRSNLIRKYKVRNVLEMALIVHHIVEPA